MVGIAVSDEKCSWIKEKLGSDASINYKNKPLGEQLKKHCPDGIDVYFDNVGGKILDLLISIINVRGRIAICGFISQCNAIEPVPEPYNFRTILTQRVRVEILHMICACIFNRGALWTQ